MAMRLADCTAALLCSRKVHSHDLPGAACCNMVRSSTAPQSLRSPAHPPLAACKTHPRLPQLLLLRSLLQLLGTLFALANLRGS
eukprot:1150291-Pelagomonas_calceolata.AAC.3